MCIVAVDMMGSDLGPSGFFPGLSSLVTARKDIQLLLVGPQQQLKLLADKNKVSSPRIHIVDAGQWVGMGENPSVALADKSQSSILVASRLVASGQADSLVSAGNTGAVILAAAKHFRRLPTIKRAALAAVYPTEQLHGPKGDPFALMLDVGATLHVQATDLVHFALMGSAYANIISDNPAPKVALLSNGSEPTKGAPEVVAAHELLAQQKHINFIGNVEGLDIPKGTADVIVCEGFLGNVALKMLEGVFEVAVDIVRDAADRKLLWKVGLQMLSQGIRQLRRITDWKQYGGAPILGLDQVVIKAHGRSNSRALCNAIKVAVKSKKKDLIGTINDGLLEIES